MHFFSNIEPKHNWRIQLTWNRYRDMKRGLTMLKDFLFRNFNGSVHSQGDSHQTFANFLKSSFYLFVYAGFSWMIPQLIPESWQEVTFIFQPSQKKLQAWTHSAELWVSPALICMTKGEDPSHQLLHREPEFTQKNRWSDCLSDSCWKRFIYTVMY